MKLHVRLPKGLEKVIDTTVRYNDNVVGKVISYDTETGDATIDMDKDWKLPDPNNPHYFTDF